MEHVLERISALISAIEEDTGSTEGGFQSAETANFIVCQAANGHINVCRKAPVHS